MIHIIEEFIDFFHYYFWNQQFILHANYFSIIKELDRLYYLVNFLTFFHICYATKDRIADKIK